MKKLITFILSLAMAASLVACGSNSTQNAPAETNAPAVETEAPASEPAAPETEAPAVEDDGTVYELKLSSSQVTGSWLADMFDQYAADVDAATNGRVKITVYHDNALGAPADLYTMLREGGLEMLNMGCAQLGEFPITDIVQTPFLLSTPTTARNIIRTMYEEGKLPEFSDNMHLLALLPTDMQMIITTNKEVTSMADFQGMKLRANSGQLITAIEDLGCTAVSITTTEVFLSLSQGVIDGAISSPSAMAAFSWQDACKYLIDMPISTGMNFIGVNLDVWDSIPADLQAIVEEVSLQFEEDYLVENDKQQQISEDVLTSAGVTLVEPSDEFVADVKNATAHLADDLAASLTEQGFDGEALIAEAREIVAQTEQ